MKKMFFGMLLVLFCFMGTAGAVTSSPGYSDLSIVSTIYEPYPAEPGNYIDLYIKVENQGSRALTDATFELLPTYPFSIDDSLSATKNYGRLEVKQPVLLKYKVRVDEDAVLGNNSIDLRYKTGEDGIWFTVSFDIYVKPQDTILSIESVLSDPSEIVAGDEATITFTLKNLETTQIKDVSLSMDLSGDTIPFAPVDSTTLKRVTKINSMESEDVSFRIISLASASPQVYKVPITLTYSDITGTQYTQEDIIALKIASKPQIELFMEESDYFMGGKQGSVIVSISNTDVTEAKFVKITLENSGSYEIIGPSELYIGNLDSDDFDTAEFKLYIDPTLNESTSVPLVFTVEYKDAYNQVHEMQIEKTLPIYTQAELVRLGEAQAQGGTNYTLILIIVVVVVYLIYRKFFKKKNEE